MAKVNYLNNKDLLAEIHKSKTSYCFYKEARYADYDLIVRDINEVNDENIERARANRMASMLARRKAEAKEAGKNAKFVSAIEVKPEEVQDCDLVFRVMTYEHIPLDTERTKKPRNHKELHMKVNFEPFKHYIYVDGSQVEVGRSHWKGDLDTGVFCTDHGQITRKLAMMYMKLVERYGQRGNWRGYTYLDEMRSQALLQLSQVGLKFDESQSDNPFGYYTVAVSNAFTRVLNLEKRNQNIRDDILIMHGAMPSYSRQVENEMEYRSQGAVETTTTEPAGE